MKNLSAKKGSMNQPNNKAPHQPSKRRANNLSDEQYARLRAETKTPYKGFRQVFYVVFGASGLIGAFVFVAQLAAGQGVDSTLPNLILQIGIVALMIGLYRWEQR